MVIILNEVRPLWYEKKHVAVNYFIVILHRSADLEIIGRLFALFTVEIPAIIYGNLFMTLHLRFLRNHEN